MKTEIEKFVSNLYTDEELNKKIEDRICSRDYLDENWEEDLDCELEWYENFGNGEVETEIIDDILKLISLHIKEPVDDWYFSEKYGDIDSIILSNYPQLNK